MRRCYFDTSAVVKLIRAEDYSADVARWVRDEQIEATCSPLVEAELRRTVMRWEIPQDAVTSTLAHFNVFSIPDWEYQAAGLIPHPTLRTLDALHVSSALRIQADALISYDERMVEAARWMGMPVVQPGVGAPGTAQRLAPRGARSAG